MANLTNVIHTAATLVKATGKVFVRHPDGTQSVLKVGAHLNVGDVVVTSPGAHAEIQVAEGQLIKIGSAAGDALTIDKSILDTPADHNDVKADAATDFNKIIENLAKGNDIGDNLDPTAAGSTGGGDLMSGNVYVVVEPIVTTTTPSPFENANSLGAPVENTMFSLLLAPQTNPTASITTVSITTADVTENTGGVVTFNVDLSNAPQGAATATVQVAGEEGTRTVILDAAGHGSFTVNTHGADVYIDPVAVTATVTAITGGNFEATSVAGATATANVTDVTDTTTVNLTASTVLENASDTSYVFTATLSNASHGVTTITTDQGVITIADGDTVGTLKIASGNVEDVYKDSTSLTANITGTSNANFENLVVGTTTATAHVNDTATPVTATLSTPSTSISEFGGAVTYTVSLSSGQATFAPKSNLSFTLANGEVVTILAGATSGSFTHSYSDADITTQSSITNSISGVAAGGTEYESLQLAGTVNVPVYGLVVDGNTSDNFTGRDGNDVLVGDTGGIQSAYAPGATANIVFVMDISGSMTTNNVNFTDATGHVISETRLAALEQSVIKTLIDLTTPNAQGHLPANIMVHLDQFSTTGGSLGSFQIIKNGVVDKTALTAAEAAVNSLTNLSHGSTNYEAGLQSTLNWLNSTGTGAPLANADVNQVIFLSDGQPNLAYSGNGTTTTVSLSATNAIKSVLGTLVASNGISADNVSEVGLINSAGYTIDSVGINLNNSTYLGYLSQVEGASILGGHQASATDISTANQLSSVIASILSGTDTHVPNAVGNDTINGGAGNDIIFGDAPNTDALVGNTSGAYGTTGSYGAAGTHNGAGADVLYHTNTVPHTGTAAATDAQVLAWLGDPTNNYANANSLNIGGDTRGGNDILNGGAGNDIIFGQGGNDTIDGGAGNNTIYGGTGNDTMTGGAGSGTNTFVWLLGDQGTTTTPAVDVITDFKLAPVANGGDVLNLKDLLVGEHDGSVSSNPSNLSQFLHFADVGGHAVLEINHLGATPATTPDQTIVFSNYASVSALATALGALTTDADIIAKLIANSNLKVDG